VTGLLIIFGLTLWKASVNYHEGEKYLKTKDYAMAVLAFEQTILNRMPWSPYQNRAIKALFDIGDLAYSQQDIPIALQAYQAILFAKASLLVYRELGEKDSQLAIDRLRKINPEWVSPNRLQRFPHRLWALISGLTLLSWILSIFIFIQAGFDKNGKIKRPAAYYPMGSLIFFLLVWVFSITKI
jgi:hypothetical protein